MNRKGRGFVFRTEAKLTGYTFRNSVIDWQAAYRAHGEKSTGIADARDNVSLRLAGLRKTPPPPPERGGVPPNRPV